MTVPSETSEVKYGGSGDAQPYYDFPTVFVAHAETEVRVFLHPDPGDELAAESELTRGVHWGWASTFVPGAANMVRVIGSAINGGGDFNYQQIRIIRDVPFIQATSFRTAGTFSPAVHEAAFDQAVFRDQELDRRISQLEAHGTADGVAAGNGLEYSSPGVLSVVAGAGLDIVSDAVAVDFADSGATAVSAATATVGTAETAARGDHTHQVTVGTPIGLWPGANNADGASSSLARADHVHLCPYGEPVAVTAAANDAGSSDSFARSDHKHDVSTAEPLELGESNAEGSATSLARSDHVHAHGDKGGGTLHAAASSGEAGFMSEADKTKLDAIVAENAAANSLDTTNASATPIWQYSFSSDGMLYLDIAIAARRRATEGNGYAATRILKAWTRHSGTITSVDSTPLDIQPGDGLTGWAVSFDIVGSTVRVKVAGIVSATVRWVSHARWVFASAAP